MILNFIKSIFHYELYILPIYLIIRLLYLRNKKINIKRELLLIIFASTIIMLLSQTIICEFYLDNGVHIKKGIHNNNFIPYGFLLPSLYEIKGKHVVLLGLSLSLFIELSQLFLPRLTDIDDIILNTFGTFIVYQLYKYCVKIYNRE